MSNILNPPAFPVSVPGHLYGDGSSELPYVAQEGMTLRDYFAAKALQAYCAQYGIPEGDAQTAISVRCYALADAMLIERNRRKPGAYDDTDEQ